MTPPTHTIPLPLTRRQGYIILWAMATAIYSLPLARRPFCTKKSRHTLGQYHALCHHMAAISWPHPHPVTYQLAFTRRQIYIMLHLLAAATRTLPRATPRRVVAQHHSTLHHLRAHAPADLNV